MMFGIFEECQVGNNWVGNNWVGNSYADQLLLTVVRA
jgi:hypothetical protein